VNPATAKPADVGTGVVCASIADDGSWLSLGTLHPRWGFVELNGLPPFDESGRGDPDAARRHRARMTDPRHAWLRVDPVAGDQRPPQVVASGPTGSRRIVQHWRLDDGIELIVRVAGRLDRPALAEITEINPPEPTRATTELQAEGNRLSTRRIRTSRVLLIVSSDGSEAPSVRA